MAGCSRATDSNQGGPAAGLTAAFLGMLVQAATDQFLWHADIAPHIWIMGGLLPVGSGSDRADVEIKAAIAAGLGYGEPKLTPNIDHRRSSC